MKLLLALLALALALPATAGVVVSREFDSPAPTHTTDGSFGSRATQPVEYDPSPSNRGVQVVPSFTVFHTPPDATPT